MCYILFPYVCTFMGKGFICKYIFIAMYSFIPPFHEAKICGVPSCGWQVHTAEYSCCETLPTIHWDIMPQFLCTSFLFLAGMFISKLLMLPHLPPDIWSHSFPRFPFFDPTLSLLFRDVADMMESSSRSSSNISRPSSTYPQPSANKTCLYILPKYLFQHY